MTGYGVPCCWYMLRTSPRITSTSKDIVKIPEFDFVLTVLDKVGYFSDWTKKNWTVLDFIGHLSVDKIGQGPKISPEKSVGHVQFTDKLPN
jgi:hypothetical protein